MASKESNGPRREPRIDANIKAIHFLRTIEEEGGNAAEEQKQGWIDNTT
jgi:hypothetical protein